MDGWMGGWEDGWMNERMDRLKDGRIDGGKESMNHCPQRNLLPSPRDFLDTTVEEEKIEMDLFEFIIFVLQIIFL